MADSLTRFNWAARKLHKRLVQLGANEAYPRGEADEQHGEGSTLQLFEWQRMWADSCEGLMLASFLGLMISAITC